MLTVTVYYYSKLIAFAFSFLCFVFAIYVYIRGDVKEGDNTDKGRGNSFRITQNDFEVHTKESIWKK